LEAQRFEAGCKAESACSAVYEVPHSGKKLEENVIEEERARLGK
jgi:hypothetical protein